MSTKQPHMFSASSTVHLPEELWSSVIGYATDQDAQPRTDFAEHQLPPFSNDSLRAKANISKVSRQFRRICLPFLYEAAIAESPQDLQALANTLDNSHSAARVSSLVYMLRVDIHNPELERYLEFHGTIVKSLIRILRHTTALSVLQIILFHTSRIPPPSTFHTLMKQLGSSVPATIKHLTWQTASGFAEVKDPAHRAIAACSNSLRSLSTSRQDLLFGWLKNDGKTCVFQSLTHLQIDLTNSIDVDALLSVQIHFPCLAHIRAYTVDLSGELRRPSSLTVTDLHVTEQLHLKSGAIQISDVFPSLETLSYPTTEGDLWNTGLQHPSLHTLILDHISSYVRSVEFARAIGSHQMQLQIWKTLQEHLLSIDLERFPSLRVVIIRFSPGVFDEPSNKTFVDEAASHLRAAGIQVEY